MKKNTSVIVPEGAFQSGLLPIATVLSALAAAAGVLSAILLLLPGAINYLDNSSMTPSAKFTCTTIHIVALVFFALLSLLSAAALFSAKLGKIEKGTGLFSQGTGILRIAFAVIGIATPVIFVVRAVPFTAVLLKHGSSYGIMYVFSALLGELFFLAILVAIILLLRRLLDNVGDTAASVARTITSGVLRTPSISLAGAISCLVLGILSVVLGIVYICTASMWTAEGAPTIYCSTALFFLNGAADVLLFLYLRKFKQTSEYLLFKGTPAEEETAEN